MRDMALQSNPIFFPDDRVASQLAKLSLDLCTIRWQMSTRKNVDAVPFIKTGYHQDMFSHQGGGGGGMKDSMHITLILRFETRLLVGCDAVDHFLDIVQGDFNNFVMMKLKRNFNRQCICNVKKS